MEMSPDRHLALARPYLKSFAECQGPHQSGKDGLRPAWNREHLKGRKSKGAKNEDGLRWTRDIIEVPHLVLLKSEPGL